MPGEPVQVIAYMFCPWTRPSAACCRVTQTSIRGAGSLTTAVTAPTRYVATATPTVTGPVRGPGRASSTAQAREPAAIVATAAVRAGWGR